MGLLKSKATITEALRRRKIEIMEIGGQGSWQGMYIKLRSKARLRTLDIEIPEGTVFYERSGSYQQMMTIAPDSVSIEPNQTLVKSVEHAICTEPHLPAPPPKSVPISDEVRTLVKMSDSDFEEVVRQIRRQGIITSDEEIDELRAERRTLLENKELVQAVRLGWREIRNKMDYTLRSLADLSPKKAAEAYLGTAANLYHFGQPQNAMTSLAKAAEAAKSLTSMSDEEILYSAPFYDSVLNFVSEFQGWKGTDRLLNLMCGPEENRAFAFLSMSMLASFLTTRGSDWNPEVLKRIDLIRLLSVIGRYDDEAIRDLIDRYATAKWGTVDERSASLNDRLDKLHHTADIPGINKIMRNLGKRMYKTKRWGADFEIDFLYHLSVTQGQEVKSVAGGDVSSEGIDVETADGTCYELKSFDWRKYKKESSRKYAIQNIVSQVQRDIGKRGAKKVVVVLDETWAHEEFTVEIYREFRIDLDLALQRLNADYPDAEVKLSNDMLGNHG